MRYRWAAVGLEVKGQIISLLSFSFSPQFSDNEVTPSPLPEFRWIPLVNLSRLDQCRNSKQGHMLIVDELGGCGLIVEWAGLGLGACHQSYSQVDPIPRISIYGYLTICM